MEVRFFQKLPTSVGGLLTAAPLAGIQWVLVRSLDSSEDTLKVFRRMFGPEFGRALGDSAVLSLDELRRAVATKGLFVHFDEVWLFEAKVVEVPDADLCLVAPVELSSVEIEAAGRWMSRSGCVAGLGDGEGLNALILTKASALVKYLEDLE
jgi:hypothetical protein